MLAATTLILATSLTRSAGSAADEHAVPLQNTQAPHTILVQNTRGDEVTENNKDEVQIINSGSTNTAGYQIRITRKGEASWKYTGTMDTKEGQALKGTNQLSDDVTEKLFADLDAALPFSEHPVPHSFKSRSFGFTITLKYGGQSSPDLGAPGLDAKIKRLKTDLDEILQLLGVDNSAFRRPG